MQDVPVVVLVNKFTVAPLQSSLAVGAVNDGVAGQKIVALGPGCPIVGGVLSLTVMVCETVVLVLPQPSVALHVFVSVYEPTHVPAAVTSLS